MSGNLDTGISLRFGCENNVISNNLISDNTNYGIYLEPGTMNNDVYLNCFNNTFNAVDDGTNNNWDNFYIDICRWDITLLFWFT